MEPQVLGERIRRAREGLGLSQEELAERVDKDQRAISDYERGERRVPAIDLPVLAIALDVPIMYFYQGELKANDLGRAVLEQMNRLESEAAKQVLVDVVRIVVDALLIKTND